MANGKIVKEGLEVLKQRKKVSLPLNQLLNLLPEKSKMFFKHYETGNWNDMFSTKSECVKLESIHGLCGVALLYWFEKEGYDDDFGEFYSPETLLAEYANFKLKREDHHKQGFIKIGEMMHWDLIYLGIEKQNRDEIWVIGDGIGLNKLTFFKKDLFDFFSDCYLKLTDEDLIDYTKNKYTGKDLYKLWGDEEWRLKKNKNAV